MSMRLALDAMGGDAAPEEVVRGALMAVEAMPDISILMVGDESRIQACLKADSVSVLPGTVEVIHAAEHVEMSEAPVDALRRKPDCSVRRAVRLVKDGRADAFLSAGNTGAAVASAALELPRLPGAQRPGIAVSFPTPQGPCTVIDVGANVSCKARHLYQYAIMASVYHRILFKVDNPVVGLLNVGEEHAKGSDVVRTVFNLLTESPLNFTGNIEGRDIFKGDIDIVVCDGFVGNVVLKVTEGLIEMFVSTIREKAKGAKSFRKIGESLRLGIGAFLLKPIVEDLRKQYDYTENGGAPLLGVEGICMIAHGSSDAKTICNAIRRARNLYESKANEIIVDELKRFGNRNSNKASSS